MIMRKATNKSGASRLLPIVLALIAAAFINISINAQAIDTRQSMHERIVRLFDADEPQRALELIDEYLDRWPRDPNMLYNKACALALTGQRQQSAQTLHEAVDAGFTSFEHMRRDPDLELIRDHPLYVAIADAAVSVQKNDAERVLNLWKNKFGDNNGYEYEIDHEHHLCFATALDKQSHAEMRKMLQWQADQLIATLFERRPDYYVLVAVPKPEDAQSLLKNDARVGGVYDHNQRVLVTRNIGGSLRHEFFHLMHYGHMERIDQDHPLWIQEGMASLYEDYTIADDGKIQFQPNERHNVVLGLAKGGRLTRWSRLFTVDSDRFMADATQLYPQVRSIFEFIADEGRLEQWYKNYVASYTIDRSGAKALEKTFGKSLDDVERDWRMWVIKRDPVDTVIAPGDAVLGILSRPNTANDGVFVEEILPDSAAASGDLRVGDVIVSIGGTATRSLLELQSVVAAHKPGDIVAVRARRGEQYLTTEITLRALERSTNRRRR